MFSEVVVPSAVAGILVVNEIPLNLRRLLQTGKQMLSPSKVAVETYPRLEWVG